MYAPSARNCQPWHFIVLNQLAVFKQIMEFHPYASPLKEASHAILICGDEKLHNDDGYYVVDCGAATQNILLSAHALGIGSCWIGVHPRTERVNEFKELLHLPEHIQPFALVSLGYPHEEKKHPERFKPERVHTNRW